MKKAMKFAAATAAILCTGLMQAEAASLVTTQPTAEQAARCDKLDGKAKNFCMTVYSVQSLSFPETAERTDNPAAKPALYKPGGDGPFPAIVLMHTCAGLRSSKFLDYWARNALAAGYVVLINDSFDSRGLFEGICAPGPDLPAPAHFLQMRDAYDALDHLAKFPFVDNGRVAAMGFSQGGRATYLISSSGYARAFSANGRRFTAAVSLYGECYSRMNGVDNIMPDIDRPILSLLGEFDEDGDPQECVPRLTALKDAGKPVAWQVLPKVGHAWDNYNITKAMSKPYRGARSGKVYYMYNPEATETSRKMAFDFIATAFKAVQ